jgi:hypothetical protein
MLDLLRIRVFDTILLANIGYTVITCAMFGLGLAGICTTGGRSERPEPERVRGRAVVSLQPPEDRDWMAWLRTES